MAETPTAESPSALDYANRRAREAERMVELQTRAMERDRARIDGLERMLTAERTVRAANESQIRRWMARAARRLELLRQVDRDRAEAEERRTAEEALERFAGDGQAGQQVSGR